MGIKIDQQRKALENTIAYADEFAAESRTTGKTVQDRSQEYTPIYLGILNGIHAHPKTEAYIGTFGEMSVKLTEDVVAFLLTHREINNALPTIYARMENGIVVQVLLLFLSRS